MWSWRLARIEDEGMMGEFPKRLKDAMLEAESLAVSELARVIRERDYSYWTTSGTRATVTFTESTEEDELEKGGS